VWSAILRFFQSISNSETQSSQTATNPSESSSPLRKAAEEAKSQLTELAVEAVTEKGLSLALEYTAMLNKLDPKQKEYVVRLAALKAAPIEEMSAEELLELGEENIKLSELGIEVSETLDSFWSQFKEVVVEIAGQFKDIGAKLISTSLMGVLL
jgi:hypothetical protein